MFVRNCKQTFLFLFKVFRTDLITAMKIPDYQLVTPGTYFDLIDPWKQEWEKGVQVVICCISLKTFFQWASILQGLKF